MNIIPFLLYLAVLILIVHSVLTKLNISMIETPKLKNIHEYSFIDNYFYDNYIDINKSNKKKIFVHIPKQLNERNWSSFNDRSSKRLNMDLCILCIKSLLYHCSRNYDIVLYTNDDVKNLIEENNENDLVYIKDPNQLSGIDLMQWESYCKAKLLYQYGGVVMEPYFFFFKQPPSNILNPSKLTILRNANEGLNVSEKSLIPNTNYLLSSNKKNNDLKIYLKYLEYNCTHLYSSNKVFDKSGDFLYNLNYYDPKLMGIVDDMNNIVESRDLLSKNEIILNQETFCLFVNIPFFQKYTQYGYLLKMNEQQIINGNFFLGEFIRLHSS